MNSEKSPVQYTIESWEQALGPARAVRYAVFCVEQGIDIALEQDANDSVCVHCIARQADGTPVGTGRLLPDGHIGRMAVLPAWRGHGIGGGLLEHLIEAARARGATAVVLNAQLHAEPFYQRHGFMRSGEPYIEANIVHITMERLLTQTSGLGRAPPARAS